MAMVQNPKPERMVRIANDYYPTPIEIIEPLPKCVEIVGHVFDPCAAHGTITKLFPGATTNEPFPTDDFIPDWGGDASKSGVWEAQKASGGCDWVITNPPYTDELLVPIVTNSWQYARVGVAMLLRLSFLEPCGNREAFWRESVDHFIKLIPVNPRPKFRKDVNGSDQVSVAWFVWRKDFSWRERGMECPIDFITNWR